MNWPQWVIIGMGLMSIGIALAKHGETKTMEYNFFATAIGTGISLWLLWMGGFFS